MASYRGSLPNLNVIPKLHFLEDHVDEHVDRFKFGLGFLAEHGGESIHKEFNNLMRFHANMDSVRDKLEQLYLVTS